MGDIADMMLDGTLCSTCGQFLGDPVGYPVQCAGCEDPERAAPKTVKVKCPICGKKVKKAGLHDHKRDVHGD